MGHITRLGVWNAGTSSLLRQWKRRKPRSPPPTTPENEEDGSKEITTIGEDGEIVRFTSGFGMRGELGVRMKKPHNEAWSLKRWKMNLVS